MGHEGVGGGASGVGSEEFGAGPGFDDDELLRPRRLYERQGRVDEYEAIVADLERARAEYLASYPALDPRVVG